jgi:hypothetical protein
MSLRRFLLATAIVASTFGVAAPAAHACTGIPCDLMCDIASSKYGQKLGLTCPL